MDCRPSTNTMYQHTQTPFGEYTLHKIANTKTGEYFTFVPDFGAAIQELVLRKGEHLHDLIDGCKNAEELKTNKQFKSSHLIPFPNRIQAGQYQFEGKNYQLSLNFAQEGNAIHGLVYNNFFSIKDKPEKPSEVSLTFNFEAIPYFPFSFHLDFHYRISEGHFSCKVNLTNTSKGNMPAGIGWHPYFKIGDKKINQLSLQLPNCKRLDVKDMIPTGQLTDYPNFKDCSSIGQTEFDTGFLLADITKATTLLHDAQQDVTLSISQTNCPYLQVYTPPERSSIAIEPMTCAADAFNNKMGLKILSPDEQLAVSYAVQLR